MDIYMMTTCDHCGEVKECELKVDPFIDEVFPEDENPASWWCDDCYSDRKDDV
jgi:hypothetical protein